MTYLNRIYNPDKLIEGKVNFFADYFNFVASQIENSDYLDVENHLSLMEKIIFQLDTNPDNCQKYIERYLRHPLIHLENRYFKDYKNYSLVAELIKEYLIQGSDRKKKKFLNQNSCFRDSLKRFSIELKKVMVKKALKEIISYLKCGHNLSEHKKDLIHHTNVLVSEFLFSNKAKDDITKTFSKIIARDINTFPFPEDLLKRNKNNLEQAKKEYLGKRTFRQQFEGILHYLKDTSEKSYYIFRIYNIKAFDNFRFKYENVTFYHPNHKKLTILRKEKRELLGFDFFKKKNMIIAIVKVDSSSKKIGKKIAVNKIKKELQFLDYKCGSNSLIETEFYFITSNFKDFGFSLNLKESGYKITVSNNNSLMANPFILLKNVNEVCKSHFLTYEYICVEALVSKNPEDYWRYFESLLKVVTSKPAEVIDLVCSILVIDAYKNENTLIDNYIINCAANSHYSKLNMTQTEYLKMLNSRVSDVSRIVKKSNHTFLNYLNEKRGETSDSNIVDLKSFYSRVLWECYSQRNSFLHDNLRNDEGLVLIDVKMDGLIKRFRKTLMDSMVSSSNLSFVQLIDSLIN